MTRLPTPRRSRWQPLRIGLVDLFHYDVEEFHFRDGRLLLRGNNGTGKSKVLALTLPFLLDGDLGPRRVEPDGDPGKRMEWNLLLGGEHPHSERLGYTWIESGRLDDATGEQHFRTLLCGLKAVSGRGVARHWYAVTRQRVDHGATERTEVTFRLLDATGTALSRDRLAEAVAGHGMVYDQAETYRRAVDEALFGLVEQRYAALVDLLGSPASFAAASRGGPGVTRPRTTVPPCSAAPHLRCHRSSAPRRTPPGSPPSLQPSPNRVFLSRRRGNWSCCCPISREDRDRSAGQGQLGESVRQTRRQRPEGGSPWRARRPTRSLCVRSPRRAAR